MKLTIQWSPAEDEAYTVIAEEDHDGILVADALTLQAVTAFRCILADALSPAEDEPEPEAD